MRHNLKKILAAAMAGNALEFYDFTIYAFFAAQIGAVFFPSENPINSTLSSLAVFAVGAVMRPVGGILFGHIGDKYGRKRALIICMAFMAFPTFLVGVLPGYNEIGIWAPIALLVCRLVQGLSVGGEYNGASVFVVEHAPLHKKGFAGSMISTSSFMGWLIAALVSYPFVLAFHTSMAWRIPFMLGLVIGGIGFYLRRQISETPEFEEFIQKDKPVILPVITVLKQYPGAVFATMGIAALSGLIGFTTLTYISTYLTTFGGWEKPSALLVVMLGSIIYTGTCPLVGFLSDHIDPRKILLWSIGMIFLSLGPVFLLWNSGSIVGVILGQLIWAIVTVAYMAPMNLLMTRLFPVSLRYSGIGLGYSLGIAIFGGTTPLVLTGLVDITGSSFSPIVWISFVGVIGFLAVFLSRPIRPIQTQAEYMDTKRRIVSGM